MTKDEALRLALAFSLLFLTGCGEYKCVEGTIYSKLDKDTWVKSGLWNETKCITEVTK